MSPTLNKKPADTNLAIRKSLVQENKKEGQLLGEVGRRYLMGEQRNKSERKISLNKSVKKVEKTDIQ